MDDNQQLYVYWATHYKTMLSAWYEFFKNENFADCTLVAESKIIKVHKVIISACSSYFARLFKEQNDEHSILILSDVKFQDIRAIINYMYFGYMEIPKEQLPSILEACKHLQIKGLSQINDEDNSQNSQINEQSQQVSFYTGNVNIESAEAEDFSSNKNVENLVVVVVDKAQNSTFSMLANSSAQTTNSAAINTGNTNMVTFFPGVTVASNNDNISNSNIKIKDNLVQYVRQGNNIESKIAPVNDQQTGQIILNNPQKSATITDKVNNRTHMCLSCGEKYHWKCALKQHQKYGCENEPYHSCPYCEYKVKEKKNLTLHVRKNHPDQSKIENKRKA